MPISKEWGEKKKKKVRQFYIQFATTEIKSYIHNNFDDVKTTIP